MLLWRRVGWLKEVLSRLSGIFLTVGLLYRFNSLEDKDAKMSFCFASGEEEGDYIPSHRIIHILKPASVRGWQNWQPLLWTRIWRKNLDRYQDKNI